MTASTPTAFLVSGLVMTTISLLWMWLLDFHTGFTLLGPALAACVVAGFKRFLK